MNFENLKTMTREQLRDLAIKQGLSPHHKAKSETIIKIIMEAALTPQKLPEMQHVAEKPVAPVDRNTPEEIETAIAKIRERQPKLETRYDAEENTWHFRCLGAEECGNMDIPLRVIVSRASIISRGRLVMRGMTEHFDRTMSAPNSAYTDVVLAG